MAQLKRFSLLLMLLMVVGLWVSGTGAKIYKWQDENGVWHYSNVAPDDGADSEEWGDEYWNDQEPAAGPDKDPASPTAPQTETAGSVPKEKKISGGLFWKIEKSGRKPSYIFGTIHVSDPRVLALKPMVKSAFDRSKRFAMEVILDASAAGKVGMAMMYMDGTSLKSVIGASLFDRAADALKKKGLPPEILDKMKPWAVIALLSMPENHGGEFLDMMLYNNAKAQGKETVGLETAEEQLNAFEGLSEKDQIAMIEHTLDQLEKQPQMIQKLIDIYLMDDISKLESMSGDYTGKSESARRFLNRLNDERNLKMVGRMEPLLVKGDAFIAIGALHLTGQNGVLTLLKGRGYSVSPIK